mmetsp:Transcript_134164/g.286921  ORF Transcript_134164/g.286921 Transcript_134164/m.286921 type:complete len:94 (-) Transcript_134164:228-509(-)
MQPSCLCLQHHNDLATTQFLLKSESPSWQSYNSLEGAGSVAVAPGGGSVASSLEGGGSVAVALGNRVVVEHPTDWLWQQKALLEIDQLSGSPS